MATDKTIIMADDSDSFFTDSDTPELSADYSALTQVYESRKYERTYCN